MKLKKRFMPLVIILGLGVGCFYLGPTVSFLSLLINDTNIDGYLYAKLSYTHAPIFLL
jgi:ABC-type phosphate/phosphonate transport system permease subunit